MVRYNCVKMTLKSNLSWFVRCTTLGNARQRAQCEWALNVYIRRSEDNFGSNHGCKPSLNSAGVWRMERVGSADCAYAQ